VVKPIIELRKHLAQPPGCAFLGACATEMMAHLNDLESKLVTIIVDLGSNITLISERMLELMCVHPKVQTGQ